MGGAPPHEAHHAVRRRLSVLRHDERRDLRAEREARHAHPEGVPRRGMEDPEGDVLHQFRFGEDGAADLRRHLRTRFREGNVVQAGRQARHRREGGGVLAGHAGVLHRRQVAVAEREVEEGRLALDGLLASAARVRRREGREKRHERVGRAASAAPLRRQRDVRREGKQGPGVPSGSGRSRPIPTSCS